MPGMPSQDAIAAAVERLATAQETRVPCAAVRDLIGTDDLAAAYAVQQGLVQRRLSAGATVVGRKIGATSKAVQDQLGVDQPLCKENVCDSATLVDSQLIQLTRRSCSLCLEFIYF